MNHALWTLPLAAYLCGSVPFGLLAGKLAGKDLRKEGSGNIGATNAMRLLGKPAGYVVFFLDFAKGAAPVLVAQWAGAPEGLQIACGLLAILGHNFPVWLGFKGGKGIATSGGVILSLFGGLVFLGALATWGVAFFITRYVSVASIAGALALSVSMGGLAAAGRESWLLASVAFCMSALAIWRHRPNIMRLAAGTEPRFARRKSLSMEVPK
jgi:glycerol-3-phosphate acyltransferase PlsY